MAKDYVPVKKSPLDDMDLEEGISYDPATGARMDDNAPAPLNPPLPAQPSDDSIFDRVSAQHMNQQAAGNLPMGGIEDEPAPQEPSLLDRLKNAAMPQAQAADAPRMPAAPPAPPAADALAPPPAPEMFNDEALQQAQGQRDQLLRGKAVMDASRMFAEGATTAGAKEHISLPETGQVLEQMAANKVGDLEARKKGVKEKLSVEDALREATSEKEKGNPKSSYSVMMRQFLSKLGVPVPENTSGSMMEKVAPTAVKAFEAQAQMDLARAKQDENKISREANLNERKKEGAERNKEREFKREERFQNDVSKMDQKAKEADSYVATARTLAQQAATNPEAARQTAKAIVKAIEGAGARVSDRDYSNAISGGGVWGKADVIAQQLEDGTLPPEVIKNIGQMLENVESTSKKRFEASKHLAIKQYAKRAGGSVADAYDLAQVPMPPAAEHDSAMEWAQANPNDPRAKKIMQVNKK